MSSEKPVYIHYGHDEFHLPDPIELVNIGQFYWPLYGWDCNSILIMNPDIVEVI